MRLSSRTGAWLGVLLCAAYSTPGQPVPPFVVGVCTHFSQNKGLLPVNLSLIREAGIVSIRDEMYWRNVEPHKGALVVPPAYEEYLDAAVRAGLDPLVILDYGNPHYDGGDKPISQEAREAFARYSEFLVRHFKGRVRLWELWNEWDLAIGGTTPGSAATYVELLKAVYPRIKQIDPGITVYGGAVSPGAIQRGWLEDMLKAGGLQYLDQVSVHTYVYSASGRERTPEYWAGWMARIQEMLRSYNQGRDVPMVVTEMGWPTQVDRRGTPPHVAAAYLARMYLLARTMPYLKGIWWYDFQDDGWRYAYNEHNFGLVRPDGTPKPAYFVLRDLAEVVGAAEYLGRIETEDPDIYILRFRLNGRDIWALWSAHEDDDWQVTLRSDEPEPEALEIRLAGSGGVWRPWGSRNWADSGQAVADRAELTLVIRGTPWLITGRLENVKVASVQRREFPELERFSVVLR